MFLSGVSKTAKTIFCQPKRIYHATSSLMQRNLLFCMIGCYVFILDKSTSIIINNEFKNNILVTCTYN